MSASVCASAGVCLVQVADRGLVAALLCCLLVGPCMATASPGNDDKGPFILFGSQPLVGHSYPLAMAAVALWRRRDGINGIGPHPRVVVACPAFIGSPHAEIRDIFFSPDGDAYGTDVEFVEAGFVNRSAEHLVDFGLALKERVCARLYPCLPGTLASHHCVGLFRVAVSVYLAIVVACGQRVKPRFACLPV